MKLIVAVIRPERLEAAKNALAEAKVFRLTVSDAQGISPVAPGASGSVAAAAYAGEAGAGATPVRKVKLEIAVNEEFVEPTVRAIARAAKVEEGRPGDGAVFVLPLEEAIRIRTGERGPDAI